MEKTEEVIEDKSLDILQKNWDNLQDEIKGNTHKGNRYKWGSIACVIGGYMGVYGLENFPKFILLITSILLFGGLLIDLIFTKANVKHIKSQIKIEKKIESMNPEVNSGLRSNWDFHDYLIPPLQWLYQLIGGEKVGKKRFRVNDMIFLGAILNLFLSLYLCF